MSKYRRISSNFNNEIKEKKKQKNNPDDKSGYLNTKLLMEKLGIKITNENIYNKKHSMNISQGYEKNSNINIRTTFNNKDDNNNSKFFISKSQKKRNRNDNNIKKNNITSTSYEKRIIKKDQNKKIIESKNDKKKKEKDIHIKFEKNIKEKNDNIENNENITKKKYIKKKINKQILKKESKIKNNDNDNSSKKYRRLSQKQENKSVHFKRNKCSDEAKKPTIRMKNDGSTDKIANSTFCLKRNMDNNMIFNDEDLRIKEIDDISPKKTRTKKMATKENKEENLENREKQKKFRKNKAISADKIISNKIFDFKSADVKKMNKKNNENNIELKKNSDNEESESSESSDESDKSNSSEDKNKKKVKSIVRSNKRHLTEMSSQKNEKKEKLNNSQKNENKEIEKPKIDFNEKQIDEPNSQDINYLKEKEIIRTNKKHLTEINSSYSKKNSLKDSNNSENDKKILGVKYNRRRSLDNPLIRDRLESLMNNMVMKQNGGNTLFLRNYEKGQTYSKEIELFIKNKNIKKKIKISSCTKAGCSGPGIVKTNQDSYFIKDNFLKNNNNIFLGVCDGHGEKGEIISKYVTNKLPEYIKDLNYENITKNFKKINNEIYNNKSIDCNMSGTTVASLLITPEKIISVNLGDSRATIFKYDNGLYYSKNMTRDHKPGEPDENKRIINNNGKIQKCYDEDLKKYIGPDRVWLKNKEEPGLAMSRSLGDKIAHSIGVIDEPEFKIFEYDGTEKFIVIASDGIWEYLHGDDCIKVIRPFYEENKDSEEAALALVKEAFRKWKRKEVAIDDITAIIIFFDD